jgi:Tfp pilus assembly protein PilF
MINGMGYEFLQQKQFTKAGRFFKMNVENYPDSYNVYDSYSDYFAAIGDKTKAIEYLKKALAVQENPDSRNKLNKLIE